MDRINLLPRETADLIAAGEVVERPASVIKELVENSMDAGAARITVEVKNGGTSFMRVSDDGCGMSESDAQQAFLRHATSKLHSAEELFCVTTLGFRGEALAALAAVSKVELLTKEKGALSGTQVNISGSVLTDCCAVGCPEGTTIIARELFFNTPARQKFLKKEVTESAAIASTVEKLALSHPEIAFTFIKDGRRELVTSGDGNLKNVIYAIFGREITQGELAVSYEMGGIGVCGFVGKPEVSRPNRAMQIFFLNGRCVRGRIFTAALEEAYKNLVMVERFPICVLNIIAAPSIVDVNVHPAKVEVKFTNEKPIYDAVYFAVLSALAPPLPAHHAELPRCIATPAEERPTQTFLDIAGGLTRERAAKTPPKEENGENSSFSQAGGSYGATSFVDIKKDYSGWGFVEKSKEGEGAALDVPPQANGTDFAAPPQPKDADFAAQPESEAEPEAVRVLGELFSCYIVAECGESCYLIDKHAAHERIIFEKIRAKRESAQVQQMLVPMVLYLTREEHATVLLELENFEKIGFIIEDFGDSTVLCRGVPADICERDIKGLIVEISGYLEEGRQDISPACYDNVLHSIACKAAIKQGSASTKQELLELARTVIFDERIRYCPHGRPVLTERKKSELEKLFKRQ